MSFYLMAELKKILVCREGRGGGRQRDGGSGRDRQIERWRNRKGEEEIGAQGQYSGKSRSKRGKWLFPVLPGVFQVSIPGLTEAQLLSCPWGSMGQTPPYSYQQPLC